MDLLPDTQNCGLHMRRECRERFPRHRPQRKPVSDPGMHHGGENFPGIPGACATRNFTYLVRGPWIEKRIQSDSTSSSHLQLNVKP